MSIRGVRPIVCGADGQPIAGATVVLYVLGAVGGVGTTDSHGGFTFSVPLGQTDVALKVQGIPGYQKYLWSDLIPDKPVNLCIGTPAGSGDVQLPSLRPNTPAHDLRAVRAGFCNLHDSKGRVVYSPYFTCLPADDQDEWIDIWQAVNMTHQFIMLDDPVYPEGLPQYGGGWYPAPHFAPTPAQFQAAANKLLVNGITPVVFTTTGEVPTDWDAYEQKLRDFCEPIKDSLLPVEGWEPYATDEQFREWFQRMRNVFGVGHPLACHLPEDYIHNGGGAADWHTGGPFGDVDVFLMELEIYRNAMEFEEVKPGWTQCIVRMCDPSSPEYYLAGRDVWVCLAEHNAYFKIREWVTDADLMLGVEFARGLGVQWFGNSNGF